MHRTVRCAWSLSLRCTVDRVVPAGLLRLAHEVATQLGASGVGAWVPGRRGPKGPSRLTDDMVADIRTHHLGGASLRAIPAAAGVSTNTVARALKAPEPVADPEAESAAPAREAEP